MFRKGLFLIAVLIIAVTGSTQANIKRSFKKNEKIADLHFAISKGDDLNTSTHVNLNDFKGKLVILDFWGVNCVSCIASMPHILELQEKYADQIRIFLVTSDNAETIQMLWQKNENKPKAKKWVDAGKSLFFVTKDSLLDFLFPHIGQPTHIWIDGNGVFRHMTAGNTTTPENIERFLKGHPVKLHEKSSIKVDYKKPLTWLDSSFNENVPYYSFLFPSSVNPVSQHFSKILYDSVTKLPVGISCYDNTITDLYSLAYSNWIPSVPFTRIVGKIPLNRIVVETEKPDRFYPPVEEGSFSNWRWQNGYSYALKIPSARSGDLYDNMRRDLDLFFNVTSQIETRLVKCFVLKRMNNDDSLFIVNNGNKQRIFLFNEPEKKLILDSVHISLLTERYLKALIGKQYPAALFIDETKYRGIIYMELRWEKEEDRISLPLLRRELNKYGLDIQEDMRPVDVLVIKDRI